MHVDARFPRRVVRNGDYSSHSASIAAGIYPDNGWGLNWSILMLWKARHDFLGMVCSCPQRRVLRHFSRSFSSGEGPFVSPGSSFYHFGDIFFRRGWTVCVP